MPETIKWINIALDDLDQAAEYIAQHNMTAARKLANRIWNAVQMLAHNPEMGRPGFPEPVSW